MNDHSFFSKITFGLAFFSALAPLTFSFGPEGIHMLMETGFRYLVWTALGLTLLLSLAGPRLGRRKTAALAVLYACTPLTFGLFSGGGISFLLLVQHPFTAGFMWLIAAVLTVKLFLHLKTA